MGDTVSAGTLSEVTVTATADPVGFAGPAATSPASNVLWAGSGITAFGAAALAAVAAPELAAAAALFAATAAMFGIGAAIVGATGN